MFSFPADNSSVIDSMHLGGGSSNSSREHLATNHMHHQQYNNNSPINNNNNSNLDINGRRYLSFSPDQVKIELFKKQKKNECSLNYIKINFDTGAMFM